MKNIKTLLALLLAMTMVLCMCACGKDAGADDDNNTSTATTASSDNKTTAPVNPDPEDPEPVEYVYTVKVQDTAGNPISGVFVQICAGETCVPKSTDVNGIAGYDKAVEGNGERSAKIISLPSGYEAVDGVMEISMVDTNDVVFVLQAAN